MAFEKISFSKEEGRFVGSGVLKEPTEAELEQGLQDYEAKERLVELENNRIEGGIQRILTTIDEKKLCDEALQEAKEKQLFDENVSLPSEADAQKILLSLVELRKTVERAKKLAEESSDEEEKSLAYELVNRCESNIFQLQLKYTQTARQNDLARERFAGEQTIERETKAVENLQQAGILTEDEAKSWKANLVEKLEKGTRT